MSRCCFHQFKPHGDGPRTRCQVRAGRRGRRDALDIRRRVPRGWRLPAGKRKLAGALLAAFVFLALLRDAMDGTRALEHADVDPARHTPAGPTTSLAITRRPATHASFALVSTRTTTLVARVVSGCRRATSVPTAATAAASRQTDPARLPTRPRATPRSSTRSTRSTSGGAVAGDGPPARAGTHRTRRRGARGILGGPHPPRRQRRRGPRGLERERWCEWQKEVLGCWCRTATGGISWTSSRRTCERTCTRGRSVCIYVRNRRTRRVQPRRALNAAFLFAEPEVDYVVFHDVDMLPLPGVDYRYDPGRRSTPVHAHLPIRLFHPVRRVLLRRVRGEQSLRAVHKRIRHAVLGMGRRGRRVLRQGGEEEGWGLDAGKRSPGGLDAVFGRPDKSRGRFLSVGGGHEGTRQNPHWNGNKAKLDEFLRSPAEVNQKDGLSTTGEPGRYSRGRWRRICTRCIGWRSRRA